MAQNLDTGLDFDQPLLRFRNREPPSQQEAGNRLRVPTRKEPPWAELSLSRLDFRNDSPHMLILILSSLYSFVPAQAGATRCHSIQSQNIEQRL